VEVARLRARVVAPARVSSVCARGAGHLAHARRAVVGRGLRERGERGGGEDEELGEAVHRWVWLGERAVRRRVGVLTEGRRRVEVTILYPWTFMNAPEKSLGTRRAVPRAAIAAGARPQGRG
jgi:hypothetical protein